MKDLSIASFAPQAPYAPRDRAAETLAADGQIGSFAEMAERPEKEKNAGSDQKAGRMALSARDIAIAGLGGRRDQREAGSPESEDASLAAGQAAATAIATKSDPVALLMDFAAGSTPAAVPSHSAAGDQGSGQASEQESAAMTDLPIVSVPAPYVQRDRSTDAPGVAKEGREIASYAELDLKAGRSALSAQEIVNAGRRDLRDAGDVEPEAAPKAAGQDVAPVVAAKSDPVALLLGLAAAPIAVVAPPRGAPPSQAPSSRASSPQALPSQTSLPQASPSQVLSPSNAALPQDDAQTMAMPNPVDQGARERPRPDRDVLARDAFAAFGAQGLGSGLKAGEIVEVESTSHFAPPGSPMQQVAAAVRDSLGGAPGAPVRAGPEAAAAREFTPTLQVLNLKLQPESLGNVAVHMRLSGETLTMHIKVSDAATLASFQSGSNKLEDLLKSSGYQVDKVTIVAAPPPADSASSADAGARRDGNPSTMTPSGDQSPDRNGQAREGHRDGGRQDEFKGNGGQSHETSGPRTTRAGVYL